MLAYEDGSRPNGFVVDTAVLSTNIRLSAESGEPRSWISDELILQSQLPRPSVFVPRRSQAGAAFPPQVQEREDVQGSHNNLAAVLTMPCFLEDVLTGTLLVSAHSCGGTLEIWRPHTNSLGGVAELRLEAGHFGVPESFHRVTVKTKFLRGEGLPGRVWAEQRPILLEDLSASKAFLRAEAAVSVGLAFGLGLPVPTPDGLHVVVILSSLAQPVARDVHLFRQAATLEHTQGWSIDHRPEHVRRRLDLARDLAATAVALRAPQSIVLNGAKPTTAFAWPMLDASGILYVAAVMG